jgi:C4-dicarboxylate transporter
MTEELAQQTIRCCYAIIAVFAFARTFELYIKMNNEEEHIKKHIAITMLICLAFSILVETIEKIWL